jgi:Branched-chain amino acid ABC-type transport system, permease components
MLSSGLALMYGMRGIMNFAHGALYMFSAYLAYEITQSTNFWVALILVPIILAFVGALSERFGFRYLIGRELLEIGLVTLGASLVIGALVITIWGPMDLAVSAPNGLDGSVSVFGSNYPTYRLFLIGVAIVVMLALWAWLSRTRTGLFVRAASHDRETTSMMGVDVEKIGMLVVALGMGLAGLAGALAAAYVSISPGMGVQILIPALMVVVIGGLGSIGGAAIAALLLGVLQAVAGTLTSATTAEFVPYVALIVVLMIRPAGLFGHRVE